MEGHVLLILSIYLHVEVNAALISKIFIFLKYKVNPLLDKIRNELTFYNLSFYFS